MSNKILTTVRLAPDARKALDAERKRTGFSMGTVLTMVVREWEANRKRPRRKK